MTETSAPFDRCVWRRHRERAGRLASDHSEFLFREVGERLLDRLDDVTRPFPFALELGARDCALRKGLERRNGIQCLVQCDGSLEFLHRADGLRVAADEELPPFAPACLDLVVSNLALHWVNDLPGALSQIRRALRPDGLFLAAILGGETLHELRGVLAEAEVAATGGLSPRLSPMVDVRDAGGLLQRAGFALPVVDFDRIDVSYPDAFALMRDLRAMGETNAVAERPRGMARRDVLFAAAALYAERFGDGEGRITATFDVLFLTGWAPDASQQQPLRPGSGQVSLKDVLGGETPEH
jgi:NADH dehydrogenase [ubiquinone] 1 alpha subcomplex assembly factor 5